MRLLMAFVWFSMLGAQQDPTPEALLAGIREKVLANLARLPNYTCRMTLERSFRPRGSGHFRPVDTVRLEVGYVEGKELYAWPGEKFGDRPLHELLPSGGAAGSGDFALHIRAIFGGDAATFTFAGRGLEDGREVVRFDYRVPRRSSKYVLLHGTEQAVVGYHGSLRADARTLFLVRLEIEADEIPAKLKTSHAGSVVEYERMRIGGSEFLLPRSSELFIVDDTGDESRNLTRFEQCRQYQGESVVRFGEAEAEAVEAPRAVTDVRLPGGLLVDMILESPLEGSRAAIGDPVIAVVARDVSRAGTVVIPKGAKISGRVTRIAGLTSGRVPYQMAGIELSTLEFGDRRAEFLGSLENLGMAGTQFSVASGPRSLSKRSKRSAHGLEPGEGLIIVKGNVLRIPAGVHMYWRTLSRNETADERR